MNNRDKILLGLSCHAKSKCSECPYEDMPECSSKLAADAEKMHKQLERERNAVVNALCEINEILVKHGWTGTPNCMSEVRKTIERGLIAFMCGGVEVE